MAFFNLSGPLNSYIDQAFAPVPKAPKPKFFAKGGLGRNLIGNVLGSVGDNLAGNSNYADAQNAHLQAQFAQQQRDEAMADWIAREQWKRDHPEAKEPTQTDRYVQEVLDPNTPPPRRELLRSILVPPVTMGQYDQIQTTGAPGTLGGERTATNPQTGERVRYNPQTNQWEPMGGPSLNSSGGFPRPY